MTVCAGEAGASLEGFIVYLLLYWDSCFKSVAHPQFFSSRTFVSME